MLTVHVVFEWVVECHLLSAGHGRAGARPVYPGTAVQTNRCMHSNVLQYVIHVMMLIVGGWFQAGWLCTQLRILIGFVGNRVAKAINILLTCSFGHWVGYVGEVLILLSMTAITCMIG